MEFEDVSEKMRWEARRVAAALEVKEWNVSSGTPEKVSSACVYFEGGTEEDWMEWAIMRRNAQLLDIFCGHRTHDYEFCSFMTGGTRSCICTPHPAYNKRMVSGLYRLGFAEDVLSQFNYSLTAHEKLELRLSLQREFWPKTWLDGEG